MEEDWEVIAGSLSEVTCQEKHEELTLQEFGCWLAELNDQRSINNVDQAAALRKLSPSPTIGTT